MESQMKFRITLATASLLALAACGSSSDEAPTGAASEAASDTASEIPGPDVAVQQFVDTIAASDMYEIEAGKLAQEKGSSQAVKDFGAMMVKDHTASSSNLKGAVGKNPKLMLSPQLTSAQQTRLDQLTAATGSRFDQIYSIQQVGAHEAALGLLKDFATSGTDEPLRDFAGKTAPVVEHHFEEAKKLP
jgi:putative membrane protein